MHVHSPKPAHSWSELFREVGIIVVGILLALGAEQIIEALRWRAQVRVAENGLKDELRTTAIAAYERVIIQPCLRGQIKLLHDRLLQSGGHWQSAPARVKSSVIKPELPEAYRAPSRTFTDDVWKNVLASGVVGHLAGDRVTFYSEQYYEVDEMGRLQEDEARAASRLAALSEDAELSPDARVALRGDLAAVDRINALMVAVANDLLTAQRDMQFHYDKAQVDKMRRERVDYERSNRGMCVADLPLDLG